MDCFGGSTGSIDITVSGGTPGYTYAWTTADGSGLSPSTEDQTGLAAGTYDLLVTDANGCTTSTSVVITEPAAALAASTSITDVSCNGASDGVAVLTVTGGTTPYSYSWSSGETTKDISGKTGGTYTVTVTDANGCTANATAIINEPAVLALSNTKTDVSCYNGADGSINLTVASIIPFGGATEQRRKTCPAYPREPTP